MPFPDAHEESFKFLEQANEKSERIWDLYIKIILYSYFFVMLMYPMSMLYCWLNGTYNTDCFCHSYKTM